MKMIRFVMYLWSLFGAVGWSLMCCCCYLLSTSVIAELAPIIDIDPAPGRSPGPPERLNSINELSFPPSSTTTTSSASGPVSDQINTFSGDHRRHHHRWGGVRLHQGHGQLHRSNATASGSGSDEWAEDGRDYHQQQKHHQINKLVARRASDRRRTSAAFQINSSNEFGTKRQTTTTSNAHGQSGRSARRERATTTTIDYRNYPPPPPISVHDYDSSGRRIRHGGAGDNEDDGDDWQFVNLYCGVNEKDREQLRASYYNRLNDVVIVLPQQRTYLQEVMGAINNITKETEQKFMSAQQKQQLTASPSMPTLRTGTGEVGPHPPALPSPSQHRFQKVQVVPVDDESLSTDTPQATEHEQQGQEGGVPPNKREPEKQIMSWWRLSGPQSSLSAAAATLTSLNVDNARTANNKLPLQFDVTHQVFERAAGLVANVLYTGERVIFSGGESV